MHDQQSRHDAAASITTRCVPPGSHVNPEGRTSEASAAGAWSVRGIQRVSALEADFRSLRIAVAVELDLDLITAAVALDAAREVGGAAHVGVAHRRDHVAVAQSRVVRGTAAEHAIDACTPRVRGVL